jgi:hypothetical protein
LLCRESIYLGVTVLTKWEVINMTEKMGEEYTGLNYDTLHRYCDLIDVRLDR